MLYYLAENLDARRATLAEALAPAVGATGACEEVRAAVECLFTWAAWADKHDGAVHQPPVKGLGLALHEPVGIIGMVAPAAQPLLGLVKLTAPALAMGNRVVAVPSMLQPLVAAEFYQLLDTSDVPAGALNLVTGDADLLADVLASHAEVDALWWPLASSTQAGRVQALSVSNLKRTWVNNGKARDWMGATGEGREFLRHATAIKTVWVPYGE